MYTEQVNCATSNGHYFGETNMAEPKSAIASLYGQLDNNLTELRQRLDTLEHKLAPVLGPDYPRASGQSDANKEVSVSPFAESIRGDNTRVRGAIDQITSLIDRLEI